MLLIVPESTPATSTRVLQEVLVGRLDELGVEVRFSTAPPGLPALGQGRAQMPLDVLAFIWVETQPDAVVVHFYEAAGTSLRERRIPVDGLSPASIEEVAVVVRSAVSALLERVERATGQDERDEEDSSAIAPPPATVAPRIDEGQAKDHRPPFRLALGYVGQDYAPEIRWNHGVALGLAWRGWANGLWLGASYFWFPVVERRSQSVDIALRRHPGEVFLAWELPLWEGGMTLRPEGAIGADFVVRKTTAESEGLAATADKGRWSWAASGRVAVAFPASPWQVSLAAGGDYLLNRFTYTVAGHTEARVVAPRRLRPHLSCAVAVEFP